MAGDKMLKNLKSEMKRLKITQKELAKAVGCTPTTMALKVNGDYDWKLSEARKVLGYISQKSYDEAEATGKLPRCTLTLDWLFLDAPEEEEEN